ncbi:MAG: hypothetical protein WCP28_02525 [Actinomycetes bacterium]
MIESEEAQEIVFDALRTLNGELPEGEKVEVGPGLTLFGVDSPIDSLALVSLIVDIEAAVSERLGHEVVLTDDRAMSRDVVPFSNVQTLTDYVVELSKEQH